jgi:hypothetical protein
LLLLFQKIGADPRALVRRDLYALPLPLAGPFVVEPSPLALRGALTDEPPAAHGEHGAHRAVQILHHARGIRPLRIVYEDFAKHYGRTLKAVLLYLGVADRTIPPAPLERQADALTEEWVRRYQAETPSRWRRWFRRAA